jgi:hypothetical protein
MNSTTTTKPLTSSAACVCRKPECAILHRYADGFCHLHRKLARLSAASTSGSASLTNLSRSHGGEPGVMAKARAFEKSASMQRLAAAPVTKVGLRIAKFDRTMSFRKDATTAAADCGCSGGSVSQSATKFGGSICGASSRQIPSSQRRPSVHKIGEGELASRTHLFGGVCPAVAASRGSSTTGAPKAVALSASVPAPAAAPAPANAAPVAAKTQRWSIVHSGEAVAAHEHEQQEQQEQQGTQEEAKARDGRKQSVVHTFRLSLNVNAAATATAATPCTTAAVAAAGGVGAAVVAGAGACSPRAA